MKFNDFMDGVFSTFLITFIGLFLSAFIFLVIQLAIILPEPIKIAIACWGFLLFLVGLANAWVKRNK